MCVYSFLLIMLSIASTWSTIATERYLTYIPHSGFGNQMVALAEALSLSVALNRTLLLPPIPPHFALKLGRCCTEMNPAPLDGLLSLGFAEQDRLFRDGYAASATAILDDKALSHVRLIAFSDWWPARDRFGHSSPLTARCCTNCTTKVWVRGCESLSIDSLKRDESAVIALPTMFAATNIIHGYHSNRGRMAPPFQLRQELAQVACAVRTQCAVHVRGGDGRFAATWLSTLSGDAAHLCKMQCRTIFVMSDLDTALVTQRVLESVRSCGLSVVDIVTATALPDTIDAFQRLLVQVSPAYVTLFLEIAMSAVAERFYGGNGSSLAGFVTALRRRAMCVREVKE